MVTMRAAFLQEIGAREQRSMIKRCLGVYTSRRVIKVVVVESGRRREMKSTTTQFSVS